MQKKSEFPKEILQEFDDFNDRCLDLISHPESIEIAIPKKKSQQIKKDKKDDNTIQSKQNIKKDNVGIRSFL